MPVTGNVIYERGIIEAPGSGLWSPADRTQEVVEPGYYSVPLTRYGIKAEMTATDRVGLHRYTFPESKEAAIVIDLQNGGCWDKTTEASFNRVSDTRIEGYRYSKGWANDQKVYFVADFSKPMADCTITEDGMYARVSLTYGSRNNVVVPDRAVVKMLGSGDRYIYVYKADGTVSYQKVELGSRMNDEYEILSGVADGDEVVVTGQVALKDGIAVERVN
jgi:putative alpha-1,2-mannosidase